MICLRCGYCCIKYDVVIIHPKYIHEPIDVLDKSVMEKFMIKRGGKWCPHLEEINKHTFSCKVHDKPWFKNTPCFDYSQIEQAELDKCRMGIYVNKNREMKEHLRSFK